MECVEVRHEHPYDISCVSFKRKGKERSDEVTFEDREELVTYEGVKKRNDQRQTESQEGRRVRRPKIDVGKCRSAC